ncbi:MAG: hypothetical protein HY657_15685 [Acidobacteria bacterium]|nr:hypothetical protein [Acidobacteriota bacterium]
MVDRRSILKLGAAGVAGALVGMPLPVLGAARAGVSGTLFRAVFDGRFEEAVAFAGELRRRGVVTASAGPDLATLWYGDLQARLRRERAPIAGLTDRATLFCLEELARSVGMRVAFRIDHLIDDRGRVEHDPVGPAAILAAARTLPAESGFGREIAVLASRFDWRQRRDAAALKRTGPFSPENKTALVSWAIA